MRHYLLVFLKTLEVLIVPPTNCHHAITHAQFGSDETGWQERLAVQVNWKGKFYCFFLSDEDLAQPAKKVAEEICDLMLIKGISGMQEGIAMGQYLEP